MTDVDVRVRARDLARFQHAAASAGWRCLRVARSYQNLIYDFGALSLDVEACIGPPGLCALDVGTMLDRSERQEIAPGLHVFVPEIHDHAVVLTINAFKDKIVTTASWVIGDLERIVVQPGFRRDLFVERVSQSRISTIAWIVAAWMEAGRNSSAWGAIRAAIDSRGQVRSAYAKLFRAQLAAGESGSMFLRVLARVGADSPLMQMRALACAIALSAEMRLRARRT